MGASGTKEKAKGFVESTLEELMRSLEDVEQKLRGKSPSLKSVCDIQVSAYTKITGIDLTSSGDILVAGVVKNGNQPCLLVFDTEGNQKLTIKCGVRRPCQIKTDKNDIYVTDQDKGLVVHFNENGELLRTIRSHSTAMGGWMGIAVNGNIYLASVDAKTILACDKNKDNVSDWSDPAAELTAPTDLCLTTGGDIVVSDTTSHCIKVFNSKGALRFAYGSHGSGQGHLTYPWEASSDRDGRIYIADAGNDRVVVISPKGKFLANVASREEHNIRGPRCVNVSPRGDMLVIAHSNNRIAILKPGK